MRLAIIGQGRMGQVLRQVAEQKGHAVVAQVARPNPDFWADLTAEVVLDFSHATQVPEIVPVCLAKGLPLVTGTTGWAPYEPALQELARTYPYARWLWSSNFSRGILLLKLLLERLAAFWPQLPDWQAALVEVHHAHKKDAPSGTAHELQKYFPPLRGISSLRVGEVIGEHQLWLSASGEEVLIIHRAHHRAIFAEGALWAAQWLCKQTHFVGPWEAAFLS
ncbi:MAG: dihydrodipicolinate reductase C-terminal domain-containing protein [Bacteroidia bacterium]